MLIRTKTDNFLDSTINLLTAKKSFICFSILLIAYTFLSAIFVNFSGTADYWEHLAAMFSFSRNLLHPENPYVLSADPSHLLSPYHFFWGFAAKITDLHPIYLFPLIGAFNIGLFLFALTRLSRFLTSSTKFALPLALTLFFFWNNPWPWSGFYNFGLLPLTSVYPYWFSFSLSLIILSDYGNSRKAMTQLLLIFLATIAFISHPVTGSFLILATAIKIIFQQELSLTRKAMLLFGLILVFPMSMIWPFFPIWDAVGKSHDFAAMNFSGNYRLFYQGVVGKIFPALIGLPLIFLNKKELRANFIITGFFAVLFVYFFNYFVLHNSVFGRYIVYLVFFLHISIVLFLKRTETNFRGKLTFTVFSLFLIFFGAKEIKNSTHWLGIFDDLKENTPIGTHSNFNIFRIYQKIDLFINTNDVVLAPLDESWLLPAIIGCKVVGVKHSNPFMPDYYDRLKDNETFFSDTASVEIRKQILKKYQAKYVLIPTKMDKSKFTNFLVEIYTDENFYLFGFPESD
ncbi:MAG: hypothetical protein GXO74_09095 [Calditrichaeota bacterium]|nr:hypothetical protein [Calditrichota bacterium]